jgi:hypothetical protein
MNHFNIFFKETDYIYCYFLTSSKKNLFIVETQLSAIFIFSNVMYFMTNFIKLYYFNTYQSTKEKIKLARWQNYFVIVSTLNCSQLWSLCAKLQALSRYCCISYKSTSDFLFTGSHLTFLVIDTLTDLLQNTTTKTFHLFLHLILNYQKNYNFRMNS